MHSARIAAAVLALVAACGTDGSQTDAGTDTGKSASCHGLDQSASPASGGGFCCAASAGCSGGGLGGWVATASDCCSQWTSEQDQWFDPSTDAHGCTVMTPSFSHCCACPPPEDAASEAAADATADVTNE